LRDEEVWANRSDTVFIDADVRLSVRVGRKGRRGRRGGGRRSRVRSMWPPVLAHSFPCVAVAVVLSY